MGINAEKTPNHPFTISSAIYAPPAPVQLSTWGVRERMSSEKLLFNILLWSAAPVKKKETMASSMKMPMKAVITPAIKCNRSLLSRLSHAVFFFLFVEGLFLFRFAISTVLFFLG